MCIRDSDEALEQGMGAVGAALELRVELGTQMEMCIRDRYIFVSVQPVLFW